MNLSNRTMLAGLVVVVLAVIAVGYYLLTPGDSVPPKSTSSDVTQPTQPKPN